MSKSLALIRRGHIVIAVGRVRNNMAKRTGRQYRFGCADVGIYVIKKLFKSHWLRHFCLISQQARVVVQVR